MKPRSKFPQVLLCSGFDPTGNAGILRDIEACQKLKKTYFAFITNLTAQNDDSFFGFEHPTSSFYKKTWRAINKTHLKAVKIGMLGSKPTIHFLSKKISELKKNNPNLKVIWDPVLKSTSGGQLLAEKNITFSLKKILPLVDVITPNAIEACFLLNQKFSKNKNGPALCVQLFNKYKKLVYLKGGHLSGKSSDYLTNGKKILTLKNEASTLKIRGTGCLLATALACHFSSKDNFFASGKKAKQFVFKYFKKR